jgi:hypothetical protein
MACGRKRGSVRSQVPFIAEIGEFSMPFYVVEQAEAT